MTNSYSLADLRADLDKEFAPLSLDLGAGKSVVLRNLLRVTDAEREAVLSALAEVDELHDGEDDSATSPEDMSRLSRAVELVLTTVAEPGKGPALAAALNGDLMLSMKVMERWTEATQPGEAEPSPA